MISFFRRNNNKTTINDEDKIVTLLADVKNNVEKLLGFDAPTVMPAVERAYNVLSCYPASLKHHDNQRGGLFDHSFEVACKCVKNIIKYTNEKKYLPLAFLAGLLHDTGKIAYYEIDTQGYDFNPLLLTPHDPNKYCPIIKGKKDEPDNAHAYISAMLMFSFLPNPIKNYPVHMLKETFDAILLHHLKVQKSGGTNPILMSLKDSDAEDAQNKVDSLINSTTLPEKQGLNIAQKETIKEDTKMDTKKAINMAMNDDTEATNEDETVNEDTNETIENSNTIETKAVAKSVSAGSSPVEMWIECLRHKVFNELQKNYHFYVFHYKGVNIIAVVAPNSFITINKLFCERMGREYDAGIITEMLDKAGLIAIKKDNKHFVKVSLAITKDDGYTSTRELSFLCLFAAGVLSEDEADGFIDGSVKVKRIGGTLVED